MRKRLKKLKPLLQKKNTLLFAQIAVIVLMLSIPFFIYSSQQSTQSGQLASNSHAAGSTPTSSSTSTPTSICPDAAAAGQSTPRTYNECEQGNSTFCNLTNQNYHHVIFVSEDANCNYTCKDTGVTCGNTSSPTSANSSGSLGSKAYVSSSGSTGSNGSTVPYQATVVGTAQCKPDANNYNTDDCTVNVVDTNGSWNIPQADNGTNTPHILTLTPSGPQNATGSNGTDIKIQLDCSNTSNSTHQGSFQITFGNGIPSSTVTPQCDGSVGVAFAITGLSKTPHTTKNFNLVLVPSNNPQANPITIPGTATYDPATQLFKTVIDLKTVPNGKYQMLIHIDGTLNSELVQPNGDNTFIIPAANDSKIITVIPGDIGPNKGDNFIDIIDYNKLFGCMYKPATGACQSSDINDDGKIDDGDMSLLLGEFGSLGFSFTTPQFSCSIDPNCNSGQDTLQMCSLICTKTN